MILVVVGGLLTLFYELRSNPERFSVPFRARFETWHIAGPRNHMKYNENKSIAQRDKDEIEGIRTSDKERKQFKLFDAPLRNWMPATTERATERVRLSAKLVGKTTPEKIRDSASLSTSSFAITRKRKLDLKPALSSPSISSIRMPPQAESQTKSVYGETGCRDNPWRNDLAMLLRQWINLSSEHHIEYVLAYGSLLGAMRNGDVIPYDSDIDVLIDVNFFSVMKRLATQRNFSTSDNKIRLVLQPEFTQNIPVETRKRYDCYGKVTKDKVSIVVIGVLIISITTFSNDWFLTLLNLTVALACSFTGWL